MSKEEFIKQRMEIDKVTRKYFDKNYIVIECTCGKSYCNGWYCLIKDDVNVDLFNYIKKIENEHQQLISFLENKIKNHKFDERLTHKQIEIKACVRNAFQEVLDFVKKGYKE